MNISEHKKSFKWWNVAAVGVTSLGVLSYCSAMGVIHLFPINFEYTGQVLDFDTREPIEGAFVLADYRVVEVGWGGTADNCVKTKGMTTGKDGKFHFPVEKRDGSSPYQAYAIKAGYFRRDFVVPSPELQQAQNKETYSNRHIYLKKQDPAKPEFQYGYGKCERPISREAVEANIQFLLIDQRETTRLGSNYPWFKQTSETTARWIEDLRSTPSGK